MFNHISFMGFCKYMQHVPKKFHKTLGTHLRWTDAEWKCVLWSDHI